MGDLISGENQLSMSARKRRTLWRRVWGCSILVTNHKCWETLCKFMYDVYTKKLFWGISKKCIWEYRRCGLNVSVSALVKIIFTLFGKGLKCIKREESLDNLFGHLENKYQVCILSTYTHTLSNTSQKHKLKWLW